MQGMKLIARLTLCGLALLLTVATGLAQGPARGRIEPPRDEALEIKAKHNLEVARWNITKRKAYEGARDRLQEIIESYPEFSRMDEVFFLMGELHFKLAKTDKAIGFYNKMLKDYPESEFVKKANERLAELKAEPEKKTGSSKQ
jgi:outer membrane protein assembly factor BamD (BamD/ComL family)